MHRILTTLFTLLVLAGCAGPQIQTAQDVYSKTTYEIDPYKNTGWIDSPHILDTRSGVGYYTAYLHASTKKGESNTIQMVVMDSYKDWRFYFEAYDQSARKLKFIEVDRSVRREGTVQTQELFAVEFSREEMEILRRTGINFKAIGKYREKIFTMPVFYVDGFLRRFDEFTRDEAIR